MTSLPCDFEKCQVKATARCHCKKPYVLFCDEHLGRHLLNSPGKHDFQKLLDDPYLETKNAVLRYMQNQIKNLKNFKEGIAKEIYLQIIKLENILENYSNKIDLEIREFVENMSEIMNTLESSNKNPNLDYLKLPSSEAIDYIKAKHSDSILKSPFEEIISEIYHLGGVKFSEFQEISNKNKDLEVDPLEVKANMNQLFQKNIKENEELKQSYETLKAKEIELIKTIELTEQSNLYLKNAYDELYKKYQDLESKNSKTDDAQLSRASTMPTPTPTLKTLAPSRFFGKYVSNSARGKL